MIAIKGFEMPKDCINCVMQFGGWCTVSPPEVDERVAETVPEAIKQGKPKWCPLVEIEAEPVRHGRWIEKPAYKDDAVKGLEFQIVCSECDEQNSSITFDENSVPIAKTFYRTRYCPHCGSMNREV